MKNRITAILLMVFALPLFLPPAMPKAQAAFLEDKLSEAVVSNSTAAQIQELLKIKNDLEQGNKEALWGTVAKTAVDRAGKGNMVNDIAAVAAQLSGQDQTDAKASIMNAVESAARNTVKEKFQEQVTDRLAGYQKEIALLAMLFNNSNILTPNAVENNNSLAGAPRNYSKMIDMTATAYILIRLTTVSGMT